MKRKFSFKSLALNDLEIKCLLTLIDSFLNTNFLKMCNGKM